MKKSPVCVVPRGSAGLLGAVAVVGCVVVATGIGTVAVGDAVGAVLAVVVGRTSAASAASAGNVDGDNDDQEHHGADDYDHVESDTDTGVCLLCRSSDPQRHEGKDKSGDGAGQAEERCAAADQSDDGEDDSTQGHSRVILLWRRLESARYWCRLSCYYDSSAGTSDGRLVSSSTIVIGGRICLRRKLSRSGLVSAFGILLVILRGSHWVRCRAEHSDYSSRLPADSVGNGSYKIN